VDQLEAVLACLTFVVLAAMAVRATAQQVGTLVLDRAGAPTAHLVRMGVTAGGYLSSSARRSSCCTCRSGSCWSPVRSRGSSSASLRSSHWATPSRGVILIVSAPFRIGDYITLSSGALGGRYDGYVRDISLACLTLQTGNGRMSFASNAVMTAAVGRRPPPVAGPEGDVDGSAGVSSAAALGSEGVGEGTNPRAGTGPQHPLRLA